MKKSYKYETWGDISREIKIVPKIQVFWQKICGVWIKLAMDEKLSPLSEEEGRKE